MKLSLGITVRDYSVAGAVTYDADALAYFTANTAITSAADKNAINTFYLGLKSDGIYTKIKAMYLPIWQSATPNKWNLINNRTFDLTYSNGMLHQAGGINGNNVAIANTQLIPSSNYANGNSIHISMYSRTNSNSSGFDCGCYVNPNYLGLYTKYSTTNLAYFIANVSQTNVGSTSGTNTDSRGFFIANRTASNVLNGFKNSTKIHNSAIASTTSINYAYLLCGLNSQGVSSQYTDRQYSFASIGDGLTDTEASNFYSRVNTLMTYFAINV